MRPRTTMIAALVAAGLSGAVIAAPAAKKDAPAPAVKKGAAASRATTGVALAQQGFDAEINRHAQAMLAEGKKTFRYDTFGSEAFWATRCSSTRPSPARRTAASALASRP